MLKAFNLHTPFPVLFLHTSRSQNPKLQQDQLCDRHKLHIRIIKYILIYFFFFSPFSFGGASERGLQITLKISKLKKAGRYKKQTKLNFWRGEHHLPFSDWILFSPQTAVSFSISVHTLHGPSNSPQSISNKYLVQLETHRSWRKELTR